MCFVLIVALLISCTVEHKLAGKFIAKTNKKAVLVVSPDIIYKTNLKDSLIIQHKKLSQSQKDSLLQISNLYLQFINEVNFVDIMLDHLKDGLTGMGFRVYDENTLDQFMRTKDSSYVLKLSQVEFEEGYGERTQSANFFEQEIDVNVNVNFVNINSWFELERKNVKDESFPLLYASYSLMDGVIGDFIVDNREKIKFAYDIDTLSLKQFSEIPELMGKKYANYFFDYVLNISILENLPTDKPPTYYFHYNSHSKSVYPLVDPDDHFIEITE